MSCVCDCVCGGVCVCVCMCLGLGLVKVYVCVYACVCGFIMTCVCVCVCVCVLVMVLPSHTARCNTQERERRIYRLTHTQEKGRWHLLTQEKVNNWNFPRKIGLFFSVMLTFLCMWLCRWRCPSDTDSEKMSLYRGTRYLSEWNLSPGHALIVYITICKYMYICT